MPYRPNISYQGYHVAAAATKAAAGMLFDGISHSTIAGAGSASFTINSRVDGDPGWISVGMRLVIDVSGVCEIVVVTGISGPSGALDSATNPFTITATFANAHSSPFVVRCTRGTRFGGVLVNTVGTTPSLTLFNGHPDAGGTTKAVIVPGAQQAGALEPTDFDNGLFYTYTAGAAGDLTILAAPIPF